MTAFYTPKVVLETIGNVSHRLQRCFNAVATINKCAN
jgi:hypothetical protein